jgi:hypothetical protein
MKQISRFFAIATVMIAFSATTFAQVTASATATATVVTPITITKDVDMDFGNLYVDAVIPGTVILTAAGGRTPTGGVGLPVVAGTVTAAAFTVTGTTGATYSITIPAPAAVTTITHQTLPANTMTVDSWTSTPSGSSTLTTGSEVLTVGATLHVAGGQVTGVYVSGTPFDVTVNYN